MWLKYSADDWLVHGATWYAQVHDLLDTERYLQFYFEADSRVQQAEQDLVDVLQGIEVEGLSTVVEAEA